MVKKRSTQRSSTGKKLYAKRDVAGKFDDIQTYKAAHSQDMKRTSKAEIAAKAAKVQIASAPTMGKGPAIKKAAAPKTITKTKTITLVATKPASKVITKSAPIVAAPKMLKTKTKPKKTAKK